jgi:hypothetical protein
MGDIILVVSFLRCPRDPSLDSFYITRKEGVPGACRSSSQVDRREIRLVFRDSPLLRALMKKSLGSLQVLILILLGREVALAVRSEDSRQMRVGFIFKIIILISRSFKLILDFRFFRYRQGRTGERARNRKKKRRGRAKRRQKEEGGKGKASR